MDDNRDIVTLGTLAEGIALITFNRPASLNAMNAAFVEQLSATLARVADDASTQVVIITGAGRGFCSGHDLHEMKAAAQARAMKDSYRSQESYARLVVQLNELPQPVVAAVNGPAAGGGLALALAADTRVCSESARFNAAFVRLGISGCDVGVSYLLPRIVGPTVAFEMMLTGRLVDAAEAERCGLVLRAVPDGNVLDEALKIAIAIRTNSAFAVRMTKQVMWTNLDAASLRAAIELENRTQMVCITTADHDRAVTTFLER